MASLVVYKDSWHYRYWLFLRKFWGWGDIPRQTSLCPYCQTMLWLSVLTVLLCIPVLIGWVISKILRWSYRTLEGPAKKLGEVEEKYSHRFIDLLEKWKIGQALEDITDRMARSPAVTCLMVMFSCCMFAFLIFAVVMIFIQGIFSLPLLISGAAYGIYIGLTYFGWGIVWAMGIIGWALTKAWIGTSWLFTNGPLWLGIVQWAGIILGSVAGSTIFCYIGFRLLTCKAMDHVWKWVSFKFNGFKEARGQAIERRTEANAVVQEKIDKGELPKPGPSLWEKSAPYTMPTLRFIGSCFVGFGSGLVATKEGIQHFFVSEKNYNSDKGDYDIVLSPVAIVWEFAVAFKHGICPIVDFADERPEPKKPKPSEPVTEEPAKPWGPDSSFGGEADVEVSKNAPADPIKEVGGEAEADVGTKAEGDTTKEVGGEAEVDIDIPEGNDEESGN